MLHPRRIILIVAGLLSINALLPVSFAFTLGNLIQPFTQLLVAPGRPIHRALGGVVDLHLNDELAGMPDDRLRDELARARLESERLRQQNERLTERLAELMPIKDLLAERGLDELRQLSARVNPGSSPGVLAIAAGTADGVTLGQTVVYGVHAVGRVVEPLGSGSASVALINRVGDRLRVTISPPANATNAAARSAARASPVEVRVRLDSDRAAFVTDDVPATSSIAVGDVVRLADEFSFAEAQGFQLGRVTVVEPLPSNPLALQRIVIEPAIDLARLGRVTVLMPPATAPGAAR